MIKIDGSQGEGGGQILRTALALSTLTGKPFSIAKIRAGREKPGLKHQHLHAINALVELTDARAEGASVGSTDIQFFPGKISKNKIEIDVGTAGSITLILQSLIIPCLFSGKKVQISLTGGTDTKWSMPVDYFRNIFLPHIRRFANVELNVGRRGYYPIGGGKVDVVIKSRYLFDKEKNTFALKESKESKNKLRDAPLAEENVRIESANADFKPDFENDSENKHDHNLNYNINPLDGSGAGITKLDLVEQGRLIYIRGVSHSSSELEKASVSERCTKAARAILLNRKYNCPIDISSEYTSSACIGSGITLYALFSHEKKDTDLLNPVVLGADVLGEKGVSAENIGEDCAKKLIEEIDSHACVDVHLADNLIPYLALIGGKMKVSEISEHTLTNIKIAEMFLPVKFTIDKTTRVISVEQAESKD